MGDREGVEDRGTIRDSASGLKAKRGHGGGRGRTERVGRAERVERAVRSGASVPAGPVSYGRPDALSHWPWAQFTDDSACYRLANGWLTFVPNT